MKTRRSIGVFDINAPVIIGMALLSLLLVGVNALTGNLATRFLAAYYTSWADPLMYLRLFSYVLVHADFSHYFGNYMLMLVVGPIVEERYGAKRLLLMMLVTALVTALFNLLFFRNIMLVGASGLVFMLILVSAYTNLRQGKFPITVVLVAVLYIGNEVVTGLGANDNISRLSHIVGALCGAGFGFALNRGAIRGGGQG